MAQERWGGETYTLLLDSHHRFVDGWDDLVRNMYDGLVAGGVDRPLLTGYLPAYDPELEPLGRGCAPYRMYPLAREDGVLTKLTSHPIPWWTTLEAPVPADFLSLHFVFTAGTFNVEVPFDPELYFFGDELVLGLRAFTRGYELFHPHQIVGWHAYSRNQRVPHWDDHPDWYERHRTALAWPTVAGTARGRVVQPSRATRQAGWRDAWLSRKPIEDWIGDGTREDPGNAQDLAIS